MRNPELDVDRIDSGFAVKKRLQIPDPLIQASSIPQSPARRADSPRPIP